LRLCGRQIIVADFRSSSSSQDNTTYENGYTAESTQIVWFWKLLGELSTDQQAKILQFTTGLSA
jgi:hypothetical protein